MSDTESISLVFVTDDGKRERLHLDHGTVFDARKLAEEVLRAGAGLYVEVEIRAAGRLIETVQAGALSGAGRW